MKFKPHVENIKARLATMLAIAFGSLAISTTVQADQVILDDLIVSSSICLGFDCVNGEKFDKNTLLLKENNLRIKFQDTSSTGSFPSNDWQITINDSSNGGANKFSIDDIDSGETPFTIKAGAREHSLYIDDHGYIGIGTSTPQEQLHIVNGNTPTLRLEQDGSYGENYPPQIWDVAGNEANFFIRNVTRDNILPFRIIPGAPQNSLVIDKNGDIGIGLPNTSPDARLHISGKGDETPLFLLGKTKAEAQVIVDNTGQVGIGTGDPKAPLHVFRDNGTAKVEVDGLSSTGTGAKTLLELTNDKAVRAYFRNTNATVTPEVWALRHNGNFEINTSDDASVEFQLKASGDVTILGALIENSDVNNKENFKPVDGQEVLNKLQQIPIASWNYKDNGPNVRHLGPMAQDFYAEFGLGIDETGLATLDVGGVALAGIKQLHANRQKKNEIISNNEKRILELEKIILDLKKMMTKIALNKGHSSVKL